MHDALLLTAALACGGLGFAWLALTLDVHWQQVMGGQAQSHRLRGMLRGLGILGLAGSLALCLLVDTASMAALVWMMSLAATALVVSFTLSWRPRWLALLVPGVLSR